jgi:hypothetical protein
VVSFSVDLEGFSLRFRVEAAPSVPSARRLRVEVGSGIGVTKYPNVGFVLPHLFYRDTVTQKFPSEN